MKTARLLVPAKLQRELKALPDHRSFSDQLRRAIDFHLLDEHLTYRKENFVDKHSKSVRVPDRLFYKMHKQAKKLNISGSVLMIESLRLYLAAEK